MGINEFFEIVLGAPPANKRWSWGAVNITERRVFLRVWGDAGSLDTKNKQILVMDRKGWRSPAARNERERHLALQAEGYRLFGVVCQHAANQKKNVARIASFDSEKLLSLGVLSEDTNGKVYAHIDGSISVEGLPLQPSENLQHDLKAIESDSTLTETMRATLIQARLGQGKFRGKLLKRYGGKCSVTGVAFPELLRASHIKPWARSTNDERLDRENGLLLLPNLDLLFDRGYITFDKNGAVRISRALDQGARHLLGPVKNLLVRPSARQREYLEFHASYVFRGEA
jgi:predicted restriction endonuclease